MAPPIDDTDSNRGQAQGSHTSKENEEESAVTTQQATLNAPEGKVKLEIVSRLRLDNKFQIATYDHGEDVVGHPGPSTSTSIC
jgi:hypothetical protein